MSTDDQSKRTGSRPTATHSSGPLAWLIGSAAVAPNGIGSEYYSGVLRGKSGIVSLNGQVASSGAPMRRFVAQVQPRFFEYLLKAFVEPVGKSEQGAASVHWLLGEFFRWDEEHGLRRKRSAGPNRDFMVQETPGFPRAIPPTELPDDRKRHWDAFGCLDTRDLLLYSLPLQALAFAKNWRNSDADNRVLLDTLHLTMPRSTELAMVSTFLGLLDALGRLEEFEQALRNDVMPKDLQTADSVRGSYAKLMKADSTGEQGHRPGAFDLQFADFLTRACEVFGLFYKRILKVTTQRPIGLVVGSAVGNVEIMARYALRMQRLGLQDQIRVVHQDVPPGLDVRSKTTRSTRDVRRMKALRGQDGGKGSIVDYSIDVKDLPSTESSGGQLYRVENEMAQVNHNYTSGLLCLMFNLVGEQLTVSTSCCSGLTALITAARTVQHQEDGLDWIVVTGTDCGWWPQITTGFLWKGWLAHLDDPDDSDFEKACRPLREGSNGAVLGEGAGTVVLSGNPPSSGPAITLTRGTIRNTQCFEDDEQKGSKVLLRHVLQDGESRQGLLLAFGPGHPVPDGHELGDIATVRDELASAPRFAVGTVKDGAGHSMGGTSVLAAVFARQLLARQRGKRGDVKTLHTDRLSWAHSKLRYFDERSALEDVEWVVLNGSGLGGTMAAARIELDEASSPAPDGED